MASNSDNIRTRMAAITAELAAMNPNAAGGMPTYTKDGQSFDHVGYRKSLLDELKMLQELLPMADGAFEVTSEVQ